MEGVVDVIDSAVVDVIDSGVVDVIDSARHCVRIDCRAFYSLIAAFHLSHPLPVI